jgi:hypothetical protein
VKVYLTQGSDGRILIQGRVEQDGLVGDVLHYIGQGEAFLGIPFEQFAQATPGSMELPQAPEDVEPDSDPGETAPDESSGAQEPIQGEP